MKYSALIQNRKSVREFTDNQVPFDRMEEIQKYYVNSVRRLLPEIKTELRFFGTDGEVIGVIGNTAMFIPIGIIWPSVLRSLDTPWKVICAGIGFSLFIEILQLPFFDRVSDIDDLLLNSLGFLLGYGIYLIFKKASKKRISRRIYRSETFMRSDCNSEYGEKYITYF